MDKDRIVEILTRRAAGSITDDELLELATLLANHPEAIKYEEFLDELWKSFSHQADELNIDVEFSKHLKRHQDKIQFAEPSMQNVIDEQDKGQARSRNVKHRIRTAFAVAAAIIGIAFTSYLFMENDNDKVKNVHHKFEFIAQKGSRKSFSLPDGTHVFLNSDSKLSFDERFENGDTRPVVLEGEAYFDVAKDKARPFTITTHSVTIKVVGTSFNIKAYPNERKTEAALITGEIELSLNESPNKVIHMKANDKVEVENNIQTHDPGDKKSNKSLTVRMGNLSKVNIANREHIAEITWVEDRLVFENETLRELIPKLERWYNVRIKVTNESVLNNHYTAKITNENIVELLTAMQVAKPFKYEYINEEIIIY